MSAFLATSLVHQNVAHLNVIDGALLLLLPAAAAAARRRLDLLGRLGQVHVPVDDVDLVGLAVGQEGDLRPHHAGPYRVEA